MNLKNIIIILGFLGISFVLFVLLFTPPDISAEELFKRHLATPIPASVNGLEKERYFVPTFGDGGFDLKINISSIDLQKITEKCIEESPLYLDKSNMPKDFNSFMGNEVKIFSYKYTEDFNHLTIYTNRDFTKAWIRFSGFIQDKPIIKL